MIGDLLESERVFLRRRVQIGSKICGQQYCISANFLVVLIIILWLRDIMALFLGNSHEVCTHTHMCGGEREKKEKASCL